MNDRMENFFFQTGAFIEYPYLPVGMQEYLQQQHQKNQQKQQQQL